MSETEQITEIFARFGEAAYHAQCLEYDLLSVQLIDALNKGQALSQQDIRSLESLWQKKTLGALLQPLRDSPLIPKDLNAFVERVRVTRNGLIHSFWMENASNFSSPAGRDAMITKLKAMTATLRTAEQLFKNVLSGLLADYGITHDDIDAELRKIMSE